MGLDELGVVGLARRGQLRAKSLDQCGQRQ
jgi:hypothetical protein